MSGTPPRFSVIVPSRGDEARLLALLGALARQSYAHERFEVRVALDGAAPSDAVKRAANVGGVALIPIASRVGPGGARNRAAAGARGEFLAFTEDDCSPATDWLARAAVRLDAEPGLDALEGATLKPGGRPVHRSDHREPRWLPTNLFVRRALFERIGGYSEDFFDAARGIYFREDSDLGFRLEDAGARVGRAGDAAVVHPHEHQGLLDPLRWAARYEMDPLLAARHPRRFRERIEVHRLGPFAIRRPLVHASVAFVALAALALVLAALGAGRAAACLAFGAALALVPFWAKWGFDPRRLPVLPLVPIVQALALALGRRRVPRS